jgi:hypothetical protein
MNSECGLFTVVEWTYPVVRNACDCVENSADMEFTAVVCCLAPVSCVRVVRSKLLHRTTFVYTHLRFVSCPTK